MTRYRQLQIPLIQRCLRVVLILTAMLIASGCVHQYPIPNAIRSGDTLVLSLGGIQRNAQGAQDLKASDLQIVLTDHAGTQFNLEASNILRAYADYASVVNYHALNGSYPLKPFDGGWFVATSLTWPFDEVHQGGPLPLAVGLGSISITSAKLTNTAVVDIDGDLTNIPVEILPGTADPTVALNYTNQFVAYSSLPMLKVAPSSIAGVSAVGGLQLSITYPQGLAYLDANHLPILVPYNHNPYIQLAQNTVVNSNGTNTINVLLTAQKGFASSGNQTVLTPSLNDLALRLVYFSIGNEERPSPATVLADFHIDAAKSHYIDTNGAVLSGIQPVLSHEESN